jgi:zinc-binding alcohol dehydrogenase/oxidoreductase
LYPFTIIVSILMKAIVLEGIHQALELQEVPTLQPEPDEAIVQLRAAAFNHRDWWIQKGQYAGLKFPIILGSDGAGIVSHIGERVDKNWIGKEVILNPGMNWGNNPKAQSKDFHILGLPQNGTFAQYVKVPAQCLHPKPPHLSFEEAAALPLAGLTGYRALFSRAQWTTQDQLLITGIGGGVALLTLQFALALGGKVYVTSADEEKLQKAQNLGALGGINYKIQDWHKQLQAMAGFFDVIVDSAAGEGFPKLAELAAPGGRIALYGGTQGNIKEIVPARLFWKQLSVLGSTMGTESEFKAMLELVSQHQVHPIIDRVFPLEEAEQAIRRMDNARQFGKIILSISH